MKIKSAEFEISAVRPVQWPSDGLVEFAFVGRSNVGKSSLLNKLLGRKSLARVSQKPGKTQQINFFRINDRFRFADLPGYGYAAVSKSERAKFAKMLETYLTTREPLLRVFQLVDIRHSPMPMDVETYRWMKSIGLEVSVIATKSDKVGRSQIAKAVREIRIAMDGPEFIIPVSSEKGEGILELWSHIEDLMGASESAGEELS
ncbi:ribosome biogenesis GTP-binding protein YihA/YsxC [Alicyclobacillus mengziensis]|uniref:Probable GTP-binding protein EngB n=1 Tax=Alicyclobacillus mengziensis TaxID=2931921 RepID=A0A9X7Z4G1_9BACL|nr:ribosome biogenesis GTP-binding protein YihA/YsxC [Alicyclobacillus mengziensis]QSO45934.1 YihA family ribosome biogenesis GTP-binding protein [Alicyclobacillus mengziensis]